MPAMNVLLITSDEHNRDVTGCYGNAHVATPALDRLAGAGTRFTAAYCNAPLCVPARASLATGRYPHRIRSWCNATPYDGSAARSFGHVLDEQGHRVVTIGKLHFANGTPATGFPDQRIALHSEAEGDLRGALRDRMPPMHGSREHVLEAGPGETEYTRYDRAIAARAAEWLASEGRAGGRPWALHVSFVNPHYPLVAPEDYWRRYPPERVPLPVAHDPARWPRHPALDLYRRLRTHDQPFTEIELRRAIAAYYANVTFLDDQVARVLAALDAAGLAGRTLVVYTSDHGEHLGSHGLWWKRGFYESAAAVPMILAGPGIPAGRTACTPVSLVDVFPTVVETVGARMTTAESDLPGRSLVALAQAPDQPRIAFSEYHGNGSAAASYMLRSARHKYVHYCDGPAQLFDLTRDPQETRDLAGDPAQAPVLAAHRAALGVICDPDATDAQAKRDQRRLIDAAGGESAVLARAGRTFMPVPAGV